VNTRKIQWKILGFARDVLQSMPVRTSRKGLEDRLRGRFRDYGFPSDSATVKAYVDFIQSGWMKADLNPFSAADKKVAKEADLMRGDIEIVGERKMFAPKQAPSGETGGPA
jgi:cytochrome c